jgi:hypothetical protein
MFSSLNERSLMFKFFAINSITILIIVGYAVSGFAKDKDRIEITCGDTKATIICTKFEDIDAGIKVHPIDKGQCVASVLSFDTKDGKHIITNYKVNQLFQSPTIADALNCVTTPAHHLFSVQYTPGCSAAQCLKRDLYNEQGKQLTFDKSNELEGQEKHDDDKKTEKALEKALGPEPLKNLVWGRSVELRETKDHIYELNYRGSELNKEIISTYSLFNTHLDSTALNTFHTILEKYIPIGAPFDDARTVLAAAGFDFKIVEQSKNEKNLVINVLVPYLVAKYHVSTNDLSDEAEIEYRLFPEIAGIFNGNVGKIQVRINSTTKKTSYFLQPI